MEFVAATNNRHKLDELGRMLEKAGHTVVSLADEGVETEPNETGATFAENALIKARAALKATGKPALADDSGLEVEALSGAPGVESARFAGRHGDDEANNKKLMRLLERTPYAKRGARFVSALALVTPDGGELVAEGSVEGSIGLVPSGENGFGYDPLFYVNNRSFADMSDEEKDEVSHRGAAMREFLAKLPAFLKQHGSGAAAPDAAAEG